VQPVATSGLAIASLVLSILWIGGLGSILAVIFGIVALSQIRQSRGRQQGIGLATAGIVIGTIGVIGLAIFVSAAVIVSNTVPGSIKEAHGPTIVPSGTTPTTTLPSTTTTQPSEGGFYYSAAVQTIAAKGYTVSGQTDENGYPGPLAVLIGVCSGSVDGYCQHAFFFVNNAYIGTDTSSNDSDVSVAWQSGITVALTYPLYEPSDPMCCPSGGSHTVRFQWNGSRLVTLDALPSNPNSVNG
jgi:hypothetical protein